MSGGKREGAGRKPAHPLLKKEPMPIKLPRWLIDRLDEEPESRAVLIEDALMAKFEWTPPDVAANAEVARATDLKRRIRRVRALRLSVMLGLETIMEHTKEPWRIDVYTTADIDDEVVPINDNISVNIANMLKHNPYKINRELIHANAARIVACVNACSGIPNDAFDGGWTAKGLIAHAKQLEKRVFELETAIKTTTSE